MNTKLLIVGLVLCMLIISCGRTETTELPMQPAAPRASSGDFVGQAIASGYADPAGKFSLAPASFEAGSVAFVDLVVENAASSHTVVYLSGYSTTATGDWAKFNYVGTPNTKEPRWLENKATASLPVEALPAGEYYALAYACSQFGDKSWDCSDKRWIIQQFIVTPAAATEPAQPEPAEDSLPSLPDEESAIGQATNTSGAEDTNSLIAPSSDTTEPAVGTMEPPTSDTTDSLPSTGGSGCSLATPSLCSTSEECTAVGLFWCSSGLGGGTCQVSAC